MMEYNNTGLDFKILLASSVHDMKNSLAMLLGSLSEITQQCTPDNCPVTEKLNRIHHEGRRVNQDLLHLLTLYRIDQSQYLLNTTENIVAYTLEEIIEEFEPILNSYGINMELDCPENISAFFDLELITGVINTIINNSYKYTRDTVKLSCMQENGFTIISVEDNGQGYPEDMLSKNTESTNPIDFISGSTGLGLYFASRVAGLHKSKKAQGYTTTTNEGINNGGKFSIFLP